MKKTCLLVIPIILLIVSLFYVVQKKLSYAISISNDGDNVLQEFNGKEHLLNQKNIDGDSIFEVGSNGKVITAYITMLLVEEGLFSLDDKIINYIDESLKTQEEEFSEVTIKHLLSHTAGFSPSFELGIDKHLYFEPGSEFSYSGVGYIYLQNIIENKTGKTFEKVAEEYVFEPLNMKNSTYEKGKTVTPYINSFSIALYSLIIFFIVFMLIYSIGYIYLKFKKNTNNQILFFVSILLASIINAIILLMVLPKVLSWFLIFLIVICIISWKFKEKNLLLIYCTIVFSVIVAFGIINKPVPTINIQFNEKANSAYTLKTTLNDFGKFSQKLLDSPTSKKIFGIETEVSEKEYWGLGIGIEKIDEQYYYWHSGINPGFQSIFVLDVVNNRYIIVLTNSDNGLELAKAKINEVLEKNGIWEIRRK